MLPTHHWSNTSRFDIEDKLVVSHETIRLFSEIDETQRSQFSRFIKTKRPMGP